MERLRLGVIGVGHLGKEHARILAGLPGVELVGVADARAEQAEGIARRWSTRPFTDHRCLLDERPDAVVVAVPTIHHHAVAVDCLRAGIALLVEKPLAASLDEANELVALRSACRRGAASRAHRTLQPRVRGSCSPPVAAETGKLPAVQPLLRALPRHWRRARPHDSRPRPAAGAAPAPVRDVAALGLSLLGGHEDLAQASVTFENGCVAHLSASRVHTGPVRRMEVWAPEGFAAVDFHRRRLSLIQPSVQLRQLRMRPRPLDEATLAALRSDLFGRYLHEIEVDCAEDGPDQLTRELTEFVATVRSGAPIRVPGEQGREALALACRILESLRGHAWDGRADGPTGPSNLMLANEAPWVSVRSPAA